MTTRFPNVLWVRLLLGVAIASHLIAGVGFWRERHDVRVKQERYRLEEREIRMKLDEIHEGDSLEKLRRVFPNEVTCAKLVDGTGEIAVFLRTGYNENSSCTNIQTETRYISVVSGKVVWSCKSAVGGKHMDRFALPTPWYYFKRAWYSSAVQRQAPVPGAGREIREVRRNLLATPVTGC